jgi:hypothetical protein
MTAKDREDYLFLRERVLLDLGRSLTALQRDTPSFNEAYAKYVNSIREIVEGWVEYARTPRIDGTPTRSKVGIKHATMLDRFLYAQGSFLNLSSIEELQRELSYGLDGVQPIPAEIQPKVRLPVETEVRNRIPTLKIEVHILDCEKLQGGIVGFENYGRGGGFGTVSVFRVISGSSPSLEVIADCKDCPANGTCDLKERCRGYNAQGFDRRRGEIHTKIRAEVEAERKPQVDGPKELTPEDYKYFLGIKIPKKKK